MKKKKEVPKKEFGLFDASVSVIILLLLVFPVISLLYVAFFSASDKYKTSVAWIDTTSRGEFGVYPKGGKGFIEYGTHSLHAKYNYLHLGKKYQAENDISSLGAIYLTQTGATREASHEVRVSKLIPSWSMLTVEYDFLLKKSLLQILFSGSLWLIQFGVRKYITKYRTFS